MSAEHYEAAEVKRGFTLENELELWEKDDMSDLKQQLNEAVFLGRFMGAISSTLEPNDICAIASRWLYDYVPYLRIVFALSPKLLPESLVYSPGIAKHICIDPTFPEMVPAYDPETFKGITNLSMIVDEDGDSMCRRHCLELREAMGFIVIYFDEATSPSFSSTFLASLKENFSHALKNAYEHSKLKEIAMRDSLTGLFNRRVFDEMLEIEGRRNELLPLSLLMIDLDDFKLINDRYGHQAGDEVLARFGKILRDNFRGSDLVARYGGEEFAVMLPNTTSSIAFEIARRLRNRMADTIFTFNGEPLKLTASIGIAYVSDVSKPIADLVRRADQALYRAKKGGKNRTCVYAAKPVAITKKAPMRKSVSYAYLQPEFQVRD